MTKLRNFDAAMEQLDSAARSLSQAANELRAAHVSIGNATDFTGRMLDLYIEIDRLHDRIRDLNGDLSSRRYAL